MTYYSLIAGLGGVVIYRRYRQSGSVAFVTCFRYSSALANILEWGLIAVVFNCMKPLDLRLANLILNFYPLRQDN